MTTERLSVPAVKRALPRPRRLGLRHVAAQRAQGFSLIEVLIALLVLAFGLLGLAFLQVLSVRYTQSAQQRTIATNLATELLDMMRANHVVYRQYTDVNGLDFTAPDEGGCIPTGEWGYKANMKSWACEVAASLPSGEGRVDIAADGLVTVTLEWSDDVTRTDEAESAPQSTTFEVSTRL